jgi:putative Mg2+ transporter-C (MgtC) family protein
MPLTLEWPVIALRLALTVLAGVLLGINRSERGRAAGLRTTLLVSLAASVVMIQTNLLLSTTGKAPDSFISLDAMRLPLGILTGMGFIGAGAILRRGNLILGVTTAATLWLVTVIGLCFGGGQIGLGLAALALGLLALWGLNWLELRLSQDRRGILVLSTQTGGPTEEEVRTLLTNAGCWATSWGVAYKGRGEARRCVLRCEVRWRSRPTQVKLPPFLEQLLQHPGMRSVRWKG